MQRNDVRAVVLAGGSGTRLWPLSRLQSPKQFLPLLGAESLLEATVRRLTPLIEEKDVLVVTNEDTAKGEGYRILKQFDKLLEPAARNTAPAIGIAALRLLSEAEDPVMVVLPSDHLVRDVPAFQRALAEAIGQAREGRLVTFGIQPTSPETGFGYMQASPGQGARPVLAFHEKPDRETARSFLMSGDYFWNSGMFVWRASRILEEIRVRLPELATVLDRIAAEAERSGDLPRAIKQYFSQAPSVSIDHGVLEKTDNLLMIPVQFGWSDVGSWDAVYEVAEKDADDNALFGNVLAFDSRRALARSYRRLVALVGVEDVSVIETSDAVLVTRRGASQGVRKIVEELARRAATEHVLHVQVQRPWGSYTVLEEGLGFKIKRIEVNPLGRLSLQSHAQRSEHWVVIEGTARVTCDGKTFDLHRNESAYVPIAARHRLENPGEAPLRIIEVQVGTSVDEADITRYEDEYGR
jgi:mannose-1-phosphate guanylyltransferase/mannose-6-phosphate isomerase